MSMPKWKDYGWSGEECLQNTTVYEDHGWKLEITQVGANILISNVIPEFH